jgi:hypothetical protein
MRRKFLGSVDIFTSYSFNTHFAIILNLGLPSNLFLIGFPTKIVCRFLLLPTRATCDDQLIVFDLITLTIFCEDYKL